MGTWGYGLWDGDSPLDVIGDFTEDLWERIDELASGPVSAASAGRLAALVGVLLQLSETYALSQEDQHARLISALDHLAPASHALSGECRRVMRRVHAGEGTALAARYGRRKGKLEQILGGYLDGKRVPALFAHPAGEREVQQLVDLLAAEIDRELTSDLYRSAASLALFGLILYLEPAFLPEGPLARWERLIAQGAPAAVESEGSFWNAYLDTLRVGFAYARKRFAERPQPSPAAPAPRRPRDTTPWIHLRTDTEGDWKFWSIARHGRGFTEHAGAVGTVGRESVRWFASPADAEAGLERRVEAQREAGFDDAIFIAEQCDAWVQAEIDRERARRS